MTDTQGRLTGGQFASASLGPEDIATFGGTVAASLASALRDPVNGLWLLAVIGGFVFFTDTHVRWYRLIGGISHALSHLMAALGLAWTFHWYYALLFFIGGVIGLMIERRRPDMAEEFTWPVASGIVAGGSLMGVALVMWANGPGIVRALFGG